VTGELNSLCEAFQRTAATNTGPALVNAQNGHIVTWDEYARRVRRIAAGLHARGVRTGDRVALLLRNTPEFHLADTAVLHLGATPFSIYPTEPLERMQTLVEDAGAKVLISEGTTLDIPHNITDLTELEDAPDFDFDSAWRSATPETPATIVYTSGTTGTPKAVLIPHRAVLHGVAGSKALAPVTQPHQTVSFLPNAHISDRFMGHYYTIVIGGTTTCVPEHERLWDTLREVRPTRFHGVPRTFEKLADHARAYMAEHGEAGVREHLGLDRCEWLSVAAAPSSRSTLEFHHGIGLDLAELWGMSEFIMAIMNPPGATRIGTVGVALPTVEAKLGDDGELLLKGPHACIGTDPHAWAHSGDLASVDEDGYFTIVGRKKEMMINSSGKNLFPVKIESTVKECSPLVGHVAVIADRRRFVSALIVPDHEQAGAYDDVDAEIARAIEEANAKLSRVERIRAFKILDTDWRPGGPELTNTMKLRRAAIEERYADVIEELYT
jgi:long-subunit acyl-CoA synthetase (AMP-forming)